MKSAFPLRLRVEFRDGNNWKLLGQFKWDAFRWKNDPDMQSVTVPAGEATDFASIPRLFQNLISPTDGIGKAAVIHDHLYRTGHTTRAVADKILKYAMIDESMEEELAGNRGIGNVKQWLVYINVRMFGWAAWNEHRKDE